MKKHDEGYVLAYVTVVLLVFCLIATTILTGAMKNLRTQQDAIGRMQDRYVAEGMIEEIIAKEQYKQADPDPEDDLNWSFEGDVVWISARYETVIIQCKYNVKDNQYEHYEIGGVSNEPSS